MIRYAREYNTINGIEYNIHENEWDFDKAFGWDEQNSVKFMNAYIRQALTEAKPKEDAVEIIKKLKTEGHTIMIITARHDNNIQDVYNISKDWLKRYDIPYDKLVVNSTDKAEKCKENGINLFIDDIINNCENVHNELNIPVYLFDSPYNQKHENTAIKRVFSWKELYGEIGKS